MDVFKTFFLRNSLRTNSNKNMEKKKFNRKSLQRRYSLPINKSSNQQLPIRKIKSLQLFKDKSSFEVNQISTNINQRRSSINSKQTNAFLTALSLFIQRVFLALSFLHPTFHRIFSFSNLFFCLAISINISTKT